MEDPDLAAAVARLAELKAEHRDLMLTIARDAGMEPETRRTLVQHVLDEEDEKIARIVTLVGSSAARATEASAPPAIPPGRGRLTVGSLRADAASPARAAVRGSLGSLRDE
jgi:hypothetical protein